MKRSGLRSISHRAVAQALRLKRRLIPRPGPERLLILPPASPGSVGDEACLSALTGALAARRPCSISLLTYDPLSRWDHVPLAEGILALGEYFQSGSKSELLRFMVWAGRFERFHVLGTDVLDGVYSEERSLRRIHLIRAAAQAGTTAVLSGISISDTASSRCLKSLGSLPEEVTLRCRDEISRDRLEAATGRKVELTADVAFLLEPDGDSPLVGDMAAWVRAERTAGRIVVGINVNHLLLEQLKKLETDHLIETYLSALREAERQVGPVSWLLLPHDVRGKTSDVELAGRLFASLEPLMADHARVLPFPCRAAEIKAVVGELDAVLSGKMHLAIACLGQATPVGCIVYQGKFEGLFRHFGLTDTVLAPEAALEPGILGEFLASLVSRRALLRQQIERRLPGVRALAEKNLG
jgi:polysaccharide pyruvyl transferase WcaK-like protein